MESSVQEEPLQEMSLQEMSLQDDFNQKVKEYKEIIGTPLEGDRGTDAVIVERVCFSSIWILVAIVPVIMFLLLYFIEPGFIQKRSGNEWVIDNQKLWLYWALFSFVVILLLFFYMFSRGYRSNIDVCM